MTVIGFNKFKNRLYRSIPLIPFHSGVFVLITLLSPLTWGIPEMSKIMLGLAVLLGVVCAYSTTLFFDEYFKNM